MIKHIGKHGDRKVAIIFREVPGEEHMALVVYPDTLPVHFHDSIMRTLESPEAQTAENLGDALFRNLLPDGRPMLQTLHAEGMIKKVQAKQVVVTPNATSHVNLDEMNGIIRKMKLGESAIREMADLGREVGVGSDLQRGASVAGSDAALALDDVQLAQDRLAQADRMEREAQGLLAESARLKSEAAQMSGVPQTKTTTKRTRTKKAVADATR